MQSNCRVIGIAGGSASGKTTLTRTLKHHLQEQSPRLRVEVLTGDAFYHADRSKGPFFVSPSTGEHHFNFNHPDAVDVDGLLSAIASHITSKDTPDVLLIEGLMVLHIPQIRWCLDLRLFVELEADRRALRRLLRDSQGGRGSTDPQWIANYYLECARVGHELYVEPSRIHADFIIRGDSDFSRTANLLCSVITAVENK